MTILSVIIFYALSFIGAYKEIQRMYQEEFKTILPDLSDLFMLFAPLFNTVLSVRYLYNKVIKRYLDRFYDKNESLIAKFFRVK